MQVKLLKLLLLIFVVFNIGLGSYGLAETSEARYAEISREMVTSGDYLHPTLLGIKHYHKPPLTYYITSLGYKIFGINEFGGRFFLGIALILQIFLVYKIADILLNDQQKAYSAALIYSTFPVVLIAARNLTTDAYLVTIVLWSIFLWLQFKKHNKLIFLYTFFVAMGLAFLNKGPVGFIPALIFIACYKYYKKEKVNFSIHIFLGILFMLGISGSWFIEIMLNDAKVWDYLIHEQIVNRATNAEQFHRTQPLWYYFALAPALGLPWLLFIINMFAKNANTYWRKADILNIMMLTSGILFILFSLFSSKLILYILPVFPFLAIAGAMLLVEVNQVQLKWFTRSYYFLYIFLIIVLLAIPFIPIIQLNLLINISLLILTLGIAVFYWKFSKQGVASNLLELGIGFICVLMLFHTAFAAKNPATVNSIKEIAAFIQKEKENNLNSLLVYDYLLPSASFYLDTDVITIRNSNYNTLRETQFEDNLEYQNNLLDINTAEGLKKLKSSILKKDQVFIELNKNPLPDSLSYLLAHFTHKVEKDKWILYY